MENFDDKSVKGDLKNLLSCIVCHKESGDATVIQEALKTIIHICSNTNNAKDIFREIGGLKYLLKFMCITDSVLLLECAMRTLSAVVDENVQNQKLLTCKDVFNTTHAIFIKKDIAPSVLKNAVLFISTVLYQNASAQALIAETGCIYDLMDLYMNFFPLPILDNDVLKNNRSEAVFTLREMWQAVNRALCFAVNNPLNERNQMICSYLFPMALKILESSTSADVTCAASSFLSLNVTNNVKNQDLLSKDGGLVTIKNCLQKNVEPILSDIKDYNELINPTYLESAYSLIGVIDSASLDNVRNSSLFGKLGALTILVKLLYVKHIEVQWRTRIILTLGHCIDTYPRNKTYLLDKDDISEVLEFCISIGDNDLMSACKFLLHVCLKSDNFPHNGVNKSCSAKTKVNGCEQSKNNFISSPESSKTSVTFVKKTVSEVLKPKRKTNVHNSQPSREKAVGFPGTSSLVNNKENIFLGRSNESSLLKINEKSLRSIFCARKDQTPYSSRNVSENNMQVLNCSKNSCSVVSCCIHEPSHLHCIHSRRECQCVHSHSVCNFNVNSSCKRYLHTCTVHSRCGNENVHNSDNISSVCPDPFDCRRKRRVLTQLPDLNDDNALTFKTPIQNSVSPRKNCGSLTENSLDDLPSFLKSDYSKMKKLVLKTSNAVKNLNKSCSDIINFTANDETSNPIENFLGHTEPADIQINATDKIEKNNCRFPEEKMNNSDLPRKPITFQLQSFQDSQAQDFHLEALQCLSEQNKGDDESDMLSASQVKNVFHPNPLLAQDSNYLKKETIRKLNSQSMSSHEKICLWLNNTELCEVYSEFDLNMMNTANGNQFLSDKIGDESNSIKSVDVVNFTVASKISETPIIPVSSNSKVKAKKCGNSVEYDNGQMPVIVFPGIKCSTHNLTTSLEMLQMKLL